MGIKDYIIIAVIAVILGLAIYYIYRAKKSGKKCVGCPDSCSCSSGSQCNGKSCGSCGCDFEKNEENKI